MEPLKLDWLSHFINYSILLYIFVKSWLANTLNIFDTSLTAIGLSIGILIFIYNYLIKKED